MKQPFTSVVQTTFSTRESTSMPNITKSGIPSEISRIRAEFAVAGKFTVAGKNRS